jgi:hypothetical protein
MFGTNWAHPREVHVSKSKSTIMMVYKAKLTMSALDIMEYRKDAN